MPPTDTLTTLALDALKGATGALLRGGSSAAWLRAMQAALVKAHTAAYLAGLGERSAGGRVRVWLSKLIGAQALPKAERETLKGLISAQLDYLRGFAGALDGLSEAQIAARAALYAGAVRGTYYRTKYPGLGAVPGDGSTPCKSQCKCRLEERDGGIWWVMGEAEHCSGCAANAAASPYQA